MDELGDNPARSVARKRKLNNPLPAPHPSLPVPVKLGSAEQLTDARSEIDKRIALATVPELAELIHARGIIIQQDEYRLEGAHQRRGQMGVLYGKIGFSVLAVMVGSGLIASGFGMSGFFLLGGAMTMYVPSYVNKFLDKYVKGSAHAE